MSAEDFILKFQLYPLSNRFGELIGVMRGDGYKSATEYSRHKLADLLVEVTKGIQFF
jgi:hypothetical protein